MGKSILLVDDEDDIREVAEVSLGMVGGHEVRTARNGAEGIEAAAAHQPDAVLLDVMMPDMDGPTVFGHLQSRSETRDIPVILLTAKVQARDRDRFVNLGVAGVISKPFDPMALADEVAQILGWS